MYPLPIQPIYEGSFPILSDDPEFVTRWFRAGTVAILLVVDLSDPICVQTAQANISSVHARNALVALSQTRARYGIVAGETFRTDAEVLLGAAYDDHTVIHATRMMALRAYELWAAVVVVLGVPPDLNDVIEGWLALDVPVGGNA